MRSCQDSIEDKFLICGTLFGPGEACPDVYPYSTLLQLDGKSTTLDELDNYNLT
jgi:hypothetical protein